LKRQYLLSTLVWTALAPQAVETPLTLAHLSEQVLDDFLSFESIKVAHTSGHAASQKSLTLVRLATASINAAVAAWVETGGVHECSLRS